MKQIIIISLVLVLLSFSVYGYYEGQTIPQSAIDNYDTDASFFQVYTDFQCVIFNNGERLYHGEYIYYHYKVGCWNIKYIEGEYVLKWKNVSYNYYLYNFKEGLMGTCGYPAEPICKNDYISSEINKIEDFFISKIMSILDVIDAFKTEDEPNLVIGDAW